MTTETKKRSPSPETLRKRASNAYIDAQAESQKSMTALVAAVNRYNAATAGEMTARKACEAASLPVGPEPKRLRLTDEEVK